MVVTIIGESHHLSYEEYIALFPDVVTPTVVEPSEDEKVPESQTELPSQSEPGTPPPSPDKDVDFT